jgi:alkylhydroperoxidase/carboxymuconolactone decarboxylase family protein YurZ
MHTLPESISVLRQALPEFGSGFLDARRAVIGEQNDLPEWVRELLQAILSAEAGYTDGGRSHLRAALAAGLSRAQLDEALGCVVLVYGLAGWQRVGAPLRAAAEATDLDGDTR